MAAPVVSRGANSLAGRGSSASCIDSALFPPRRQLQAQAPLAEAIAGAEGVVNLAGEPIAKKKRWDPEHLPLLLDSRCRPTRPGWWRAMALPAAGNLRARGRLRGGCLWAASPEAAPFRWLRPARQQTISWVGSAASGRRRRRSAAFSRVVTLRIGIVSGPTGGRPPEDVAGVSSRVSVPIGTGGGGPKIGLSWIQAQRPLPA